MCLSACYWARIPRVVFGATSYDVARYGFEDLQLYRELSQPASGRSLREDTADETSAVKRPQCYASGPNAFRNPSYPSTSVPRQKF